jgi:hypothetical protein
MYTCDPFQLNISKLQCVTDDVIAKCASTSRHTLQTVQLRSCSKLLGASLPDLVHNCISLIELDISGCLHLDTRRVSDIVDKLKCDVNARQHPITIVVGGRN